LTSETPSTVSEVSTRYYSEPLEQITLPGTWYKNEVSIIRKLYPELSRHNKTKRNTWKDVFNEYIAEMQRTPSLRADAIKYRNLEKEALEEEIKKRLEEE
jgi:hypothetical protein